METSMVNDRQSPPEVQLDLRDQTSPPNVFFIDLDLLDDNPHQPRAERDELKAQQLCESIANQGQLQPILVRRAGARWQIIFGHSRVEALRKLRAAAKTEADRARFSKVRAEERADVSDEQMLLLGLLENIQREDLSPVDCSEALFRLASLCPELDTIEAISRKVHLEPPKVKRLFRLYTAPQLIKDAVSKGKTFVVPIGAEDSDPKAEHWEPEEGLQMQETRKLELSSALSLARLHARWCNPQAGQTASTEGTPDERMAALIDRVLKQEWGVRRVRLEVAKLAHGEAGSAAIDESSAAEGDKDTVAFKVKRTKVVIFTERMAQMNEAQKAELKSVLAPIWNQLGGETQAQPTRDNEALDWIRHLPQLRRDWKAMAQGCRKLWRIFLVYVVGKSPVPADQFPGPVQLPSYGDPRPPNADAPSHPRRLPRQGEKAAPNAVQSASTPARISQGQPVALLPTGKDAPSTKPPMSNGSERQLSSSS